MCQASALGVTAPTQPGATCVPVPVVLPAAWMGPAAWVRQGPRGLAGQRAGRRQAPCSSVSAIPLPLGSSYPIFFEPQIPSPLAFRSLPIRLCALWTPVRKPLWPSISALQLSGPWSRSLGCTVLLCPPAPQTLCLSGSLAAFLPRSPPNAPLTLWPLSLCSSGATASISMPFCLSPSLVLCLYVPLSTPKDFLRAPHLPPHSDREPERSLLESIQQIQNRQLPTPGSPDPPARVGFSGPCLPLDAHLPVLPHTQPGVLLHPAILMSWSLDIRRCWWPILQARTVDLLVGDGQSPGLGKRGALAVSQHPLGPSAWASTRQGWECCVWSCASVLWPMPDPQFLLWRPWPAWKIYQDTSPGLWGPVPATKQLSLGLNQGQVASEHGLGFSSGF